MELEKFQRNLTNWRGILKCLNLSSVEHFFKILNGRICWHKSSLILNDLWKLWHQQKSNLEQDLNKNLQAVIFIFFDWTGIPTFSMQKSAEPRGGCVIRKTTVSPQAVCPSAAQYPKNFYVKVPSLRQLVLKRLMFHPPGPPGPPVQYRWLKRKAQTAITVLGAV